MDWERNWSLDEIACFKDFLLCWCTGLRLSLPRSFACTRPGSASEKSSGQTCGTAFT
ncbi:hypothetical protein K438DRAFT_1859938 [Mycena galopus ATCC 62051]|nr:hypothetical protein K438DRAFT_1859938 [Mycena galopus ATCC 62051]